eukprot:PLAT5766.1.p1 GENE.PLAT5766.1~~PLAT5766.1.p1  ORF type:complete len:257 (+),score=86.85 PLAT5766.1:34-804(+)
MTRLVLVVAALVVAVAAQSSDVCSWGYGTCSSAESVGFYALRELCSASCVESSAGCCEFNSYKCQKGAAVVTSAAYTSSEAAQCVYAQLVTFLRSLAVSTPAGGRRLRARPISVPIGNRLGLVVPRFVSPLKPVFSSHDTCSINCQAQGRTAGTEPWADCVLACMENDGVYSSSTRQILLPMRPTAPKSVAFQQQGADAATAAAAVEEGDGTADIVMGVTAGVLTLAIVGLALRLQQRRPELAEGRDVDAEMASAA